MITLQAKCQCLGARIHCLGGRRRQCSICKRTWSIRPKKRGPKRRRIMHDLPTQKLLERHSGPQLGRRHRCSRDSIYRRSKAAVTWLNQQPSSLVIPTGDLLLMIDGLHFVFADQRWIHHTMAVRPAVSNVAFFLPPIWHTGGEDTVSWRQAIATIPGEIEVRIRALICDGFASGKILAREHGWILQQCHQHLRASIESAIGPWHKKLPGHSVRQAIYKLIDAALMTQDESRLPILLGQLWYFSTLPDCPRRWRNIVRRFRREVETYRSYLQYPELRLPTTTNSVESMHNLIRQAVKYVNSIAAAKRWTEAFIRLHPTITCNGLILTQK